MYQRDLEFIFHPNSIALVGITTTAPEHWTRTFLDGLIEFEFDHPFYLVNPKDGEIKGHKVYTSLKDVPGSVDHVIGLVNARLALELVEECAQKGVRAIHFCTAGFSETGEEWRIKLEAELAEVARRKGIRIIGPNCMGIYCPQSRLSFSAAFPRESGPVGLISQSGGNSIYLVRQAALRGVRFSKVVSYGNACDINESELLEYLANDADTKMIDVLVTLLFLPLPRGKNALLFGAGGGASVLIADQFESRGLRVPPIPAKMVAQISEFTPIAGNILRNPVDYSQAMFNTESVIKTFGILSGWEGADFLVIFIRTGQFTASRISDHQLENLLMSRFPIKQGQLPKPVAMVIEHSIIPHEAEAILAAIRNSISSGLPVYYSFASAATAINLVLDHARRQSDGS
jgi:acyl-CoA synthetase (NDP forming)